jgi:hypothetical protein
MVCAKLWKLQERKKRWEKARNATGFSLNRVQLALELWLEKWFVGRVSDVVGWIKLYPNTQRGEFTWKTLISTGRGSLPSEKMSTPGLVRCQKCGKPLGYVTVLAKGLTPLMQPLQNVKVVAVCMDCSQKKKWPSCSAISPLSRSRPRMRHVTLPLRKGKVTTK